METCQESREKMQNSSITRWITELNGDGDRAAKVLWDEYFDRLLAVARSHLPRGTEGFDEEDVALSAFAGFCRAAQNGRFPSLSGRDELWRLLAVITARKARQRSKGERAAKRGGLDRPLTLTAARELVSPTCDPLHHAAILDEFRRLFQLLADVELQHLAAWKLSGLTDDEAAIRMGCSRRTIQRMLRVIRDMWADADGERHGPK